MGNIFPICSLRRWAKQLDQEKKNDYDSLTSWSPIILGFGIGLVLTAGWFYFTWYIPLKRNFDEHPQPQHNQ